jgi:guanylate kinase
VKEQKEKVKKMYKIIALMGEAGSGKSACLKALLASNPAYHKIVTCTTRPPREGEIDGEDYYFLSIKDFEGKVKNGGMLEWTTFNGWLYGTPISSLSNKNINIGVFNPAGVQRLVKLEQINQEKVETKVYYLRASAKERLLRQLNREENPCVDEIIRRLSADKEDFRHISDIPFIPLDNETIEDYVKMIKTIDSNKFD